MTLFLCRNYDIRTGAPLAILLPENADAILQVGWYPQNNVKSVLSTRGVFMVFYHGFYLLGHLNIQTVFHGQRIFHICKLRMKNVDLGRWLSQ